MFAGRVIEPLDDEILDEALVRLAEAYSSEPGIGVLLEEIARLHSLVRMPPADRVANGLPPTAGVEGHNLDGLLVDLRERLGVHPARSMSPMQCRHLAGRLVVEAGLADRMRPGCRWWA